MLIPLFKYVKSVAYMRGAIITIIFNCSYNATDFLTYEAANSLCFPLSIIKSASISASASSILLQISTSSCPLVVASIKLSACSLVHKIVAINFGLSFIPSASDIRFPVLTVFLGASVSSLLPMLSGSIFFCQPLNLDLTFAYFDARLLYDCPVLSSVPLVPTYLSRPGLLPAIAPLSCPGSPLSPLPPLALSPIVSTLPSDFRVSSVLGWLASVALLEWLRSLSDKDSLMLAVL